MTYTYTYTYTKNKNLYISLVYKSFFLTYKLFNLETSANSENPSYTPIKKH